MSIMNEFAYTFENVKSIDISYYDPINPNEKPTHINNTTKGIKLSKLIDELTEILSARGDGYIVDNDSADYFISGLSGTRILCRDTTNLPNYAIQICDDEEEDPNIVESIEYSFTVLHLKED